jgi:hypothetical protein
MQAQNDNDYDKDYIPNNEQGYMHMPPSYDMARRATMATQLAVQAANKRVRTWQEQVPLGSFTVAIFHSFSDFIFGSFC